ncbi:MAG: RluA family pseudouridine synthase [Muricoprocola sp.]
MIRKIEYTCSQEEAGSTIWEYLKKRQYSRHIITHLKQTQRGIVRNGEWAYIWQKLEAGDVLQIQIVEEASSEHIEPVQMELDIVYEDEDLVIINKPADMPIHPSINNYENTLANGLAWYYRNQGEEFVFRCINRLDRDTTGILIVAKNMLSGAILSDRVRKREIHRQYLAIVAGNLPDEGIIDAPIARKAESVIERCVDFEHGERAVTHYRCLERKGEYSLALLKLETGRTHQIRVHMKYLGYPVIGDYLYYPDYRKIDHQALHSYILEFRHPITGEQMRFEQQPPWEL